MTATSPFVNAAGKPYQGTNILAETPDFATKGKGVTMDPRILDIIKTAAETFPLKAEAFSGVQDRTAGTTNHPGGWAIDIRLYDDKGKPLANSPQDAARQGQKLSDSYRTYEAFAQTAKDIQMRKYPELNDQFRWGGYFVAGVQPLDLMHFDINPQMKGQMGGGTFEAGLGPEGQKMLPGAKSEGMTAVTTRQLADLGYTGPNAVTNYQRATGLNPDGVIGPKTMVRVAQDVTPPDRIPNPYGLNDVVAAIRAGDPAALKTAMATTSQQVDSAIKGGTPTDQIDRQFGGFVQMLAPTEQTVLKAHYAANPDLQAAIPQSVKPYFDAVVKAAPANPPSWIPPSLARLAQPATGAAAPGAPRLAAPPSQEQQIVTAMGPRAWGPNQLASARDMAKYGVDPTDVLGHPYAPTPAGGPSPAPPSPALVASKAADAPAGQPSTATAPKPNLNPIDTAQPRLRPTSVASAATNPMAAFGKALSGLGDSLGTPPPAPQVDQSQSKPMPMPTPRPAMAPTMAPPVPRLMPQQGLEALLSQVGVA